MQQTMATLRTGKEIRPGKSTFIFQATFGSSGLLFLYYSAKQGYSAKHEKSAPEIHYQKGRALFFESILLSLLPQPTQAGLFHSTTN